MIEPKVCPFCRYKNLSVRGQIKFFVHCLYCLSDGPVSDSPGGAVQIWNTRRKNDKQQN